MTNRFHFYDELANKLLAKKNQDSLAILTKTRSLLFLWTATTIVMWFYVLYCFMAYGTKSPVSWGGLICTIIHSFTPFIFKLTQSFSIAGLNLSLSGLCFQVLFCLYSGGIFSPAAIWLTFHPVILGFFGSTGLIIFSVSLNFILVMLLFTLGHLGMLPANSLPDVYRNSMIITSYVGLDILVAAFTITAIRINTQKNNELSKIKDLTENLLRILCHDINNPLTIITNSSKSLESEDPEIVQRSIGRIKRAGDDIHKITTSVGSWMAHKDGKMLYLPQRIPIQDVVDHIHFSFEDKLKEKDLVLKIDLLDCAIDLIGDRTAILYQIFNNIISNAIKFSFVNSVIDISIRLEGDNACIKFRDHGVGVKLEKIDKIFSPYDRTTSKGTNDEIGTGFGLPIVAAVTERMNGKIFMTNIESKDPGQKGTLITVYLPGEKRATV